MPQILPVWDKQTCRTWVKKKIAAMDEVTRSDLAARACANAAKLPEFERAKTLLAYKSIKGECSPDALVSLAIKQGKRVAFPLCLADNTLALYVARCEEDFKIGSYGIAEPDSRRCVRISIDKVDLAIVPGLAFDVACNRLGRGAGYYDRLLCEFRGIKAGFAYQCQVFHSISTQAHDIRMDYVVTNNGIIVNYPQ